MAIHISASIQPAILPLLVTCVYCGHVVPMQEATSFERIEAIDGDETNLSAENIRFTGKIEYECQACLNIEILKGPAILMHHASFKRGYEIAMDNVREGNFEDALTDDEIVDLLKKTFADYAASPNEDALRYTIGSLAGLITGVTVLPVTEGALVEKQLCS